jgi:hypothetical protein
VHSSTGEDEQRTWRCSDDVRNNRRRVPQGKHGLRPSERSGRRRLVSTAADMQSRLENHRANFKTLAGDTRYISRIRSVSDLQHGMLGTRYILYHCTCSLVLLGSDDIAETRVVQCASKNVLRASTVADAEMQISVLLSKPGTCRCCQLLNILKKKQISGYGAFWRPWRKKRCYNLLQTHIR